jgi:hypothetical protein
VFRPSVLGLLMSPSLSLSLSGACFFLGTTQQEEQDRRQSAAGCRACVAQLVHTDVPCLQDRQQSTAGVGLGLCSLRIGW